MKIYNLESAAKDLSVVDIGKKTEEVSTNGLKMLFPFGEHDVGLLRFKGSTPWEEPLMTNFCLWWREKQP